MTITELLTQLNTQPETVDFTQVMQVISDNYTYSPATFCNGELTNLAGTNEGSCKIFSFATINNLNVEQTLACFGTYYRNDVLNNPQGEDHQNIRNFMVLGWEGIKFDTSALAIS